MTADGAKPVDGAKLARKAELAVPQPSESDAAKPSIGTIGPMKAIGRAWEEPAQLLVQLEELKKHESLRSGQAQALVSVHKLGPAIAVGAAETTAILQHLEQLTGESPSLLTKVNDETLAANLSRTSHALARRIPVWKQIGQMGGMAAADAPVPAVDPRSFNKCLSDIDRLTNNSSEGHAWRKYLLIESLHDWAARRRTRRTVAARPGRAGAQAFQPNVGHFAPAAVPHLRADGLAPSRDVAIRPNRWNQIVCCNTWRTTRRAGGRQRCPAASARLPISWRSARDRHSENWASGSMLHYRNANIRIAVTAELSQPHDSQAGTGVRPVNDTIQGVPVQARAWWQTRLPCAGFPIRTMSDWRWRSTAKWPL